MDSYLLFFEGTEVVEKRKPRRRGRVEKVLHSSGMLKVFFNDGSTRVCAPNDLERVPQKHAS